MFGDLLQTITLVFSFIFTILLIYILSNIANKFNKIKPEKYIEILEKYYISKDTFIIVIKIGHIGKVMLVTQNNTTIISDLNETELSEIRENEKNINEFIKIKDKCLNILNLKEKKGKAK